MANRFLTQLEDVPKTVIAPSSTNRFLSQIEGVEIPENFSRTLEREAYQLPLGYLQKYTYPADVAKIIGTGEALAEAEELEERLPELKKKFGHLAEKLPEKLDREKYMQAVQQASEEFPTQSRLERAIEENTGLPLQAKTGIQKGLRLAGTAAAFRPGGLAEKATAGVVAPATSGVLQAAGVPEGVAETAGLLASGVAPSPQAAIKTKPSGMIERQFEKITKPTKVTPARYEAINQALEKDFKDLSKGILSKNRTYAVMQHDPMFKEKLSHAFDLVEQVAETLPTKSRVFDVDRALRDRSGRRGGVGFAPDEFEKAYRKQIVQIRKDLLRGAPATTKAQEAFLKSKEVSAPQLVEQFRKNNRSLGELFEPGKSSAQNRAKKEALLDFNRAIEDVIDYKYPNSTFQEAFKFTNKRWQEVSDLEKIDKFMDDLFKGDIDFKKAKQLFASDKKHVAQPFKRILGEEGFQDFQVLTRDLLTTEKAHALITKAENLGFKDFGKLSLEFLIHPKIAGAHLGAKYGKAFYQMLLDKPQLIVTWKKGIDLTKRGAFAQAAKQFETLDEELKKGRQSPLTHSKGQ